MAPDLSALGHALWSASGALLGGLEVTLLTASASLALGLVIAAPLAALAVFGPRLLAVPVAAYVFLLRGTPLLVTILFLYFAVAALGRPLPAAVAATLAMGLFAGAYLTEILRGALRSIPRPQIEAAKAIGLTFIQRLRDVMAPLALRRAMPSVANVAVEMVKGSTLVSALGVADLLATGQQIAMRTLLIGEVYLALWAIYLSLNLGVTALARWCEARYRHVVY
jgi:polar amino acid transport system permease protein